MSAGNKDNGLMEAIAVAALLFLFWKFLRKREQEGIKQAEPPTTPAEFDLNKVCDKIIYEPLSTNDLRQSNLYGPGWCYRGDRSVIDESAGFGDAYSEKQADDYQQMKQEEAVFINNKRYIQFRLINSTSSPITTDILNATSNDSAFSPIPGAVVASAATAVTTSGFTANWEAVTGATGYYLDVATDSGFTSLVTGYNNKDVDNVLNYDVSGLDPGTDYYYRVRAYNDSGTGDSSNTITANTLLDAPVASAATAITTSGFTANWEAATGATGYYLDVATDSGFTSFVTGYNNKDVGNVLSYDVSGLDPGTDYFYRIRAYNSYDTSDNSNTETLTTVIVFNDWFLPSRDELNFWLSYAAPAPGIYYWSSSEYSANPTIAAYAPDLITPTSVTIKANNTIRVRAARTFSGSPGEYSMGDTGPAGGIIFAYSSGLYYEGSPADLSTGYVYSNIDSVAIGASAQSTAVGGGTTNTDAIIAQAGHLYSAAKLCKDYSV